MRRLTIFLDDGGVMNDNAIRVPQWQQLVAEYLAPRLGGEHDRWAEANRVVAERAWDAWMERERQRPDLGYRASHDIYLKEWLTWMCDHIVVAAPQGNECLRLARDASSYFTRRVRAAYPGAVDAIRALHADGYTLMTASGEASEDLEGYLAGMGVRGCFTSRLYGPDFIDVSKLHPDYYRRIFDDARVAAGDAVVVDNEPEAVGHASAAGAATVLVADHRDASGGGGSPMIAALAELPALLERL